MKSKLVMLKGLPGSGKSTYAKKMVASSENQYGRVNRDDLRAMIFDGVWTGKREGVIVEVEKAIAEILLKNKITPVIDDTNLTIKHEDLWKNFSTENVVEFNIETMPTSLQECINRDRLREKPVGEAIIQRMALDSGLIDFSEKKIIWVDVDGTLANGEHREHFVTLVGNRIHRPEDLGRHRRVCRRRKAAGASTSRRTRGNGCPISAVGVATA